MWGNMSTKLNFSVSGFTELFNSLNEGILILQKDKGVVFANVPAERMLGYSSREMANKKEFSGDWETIDQNNQVLDEEQLPSVKYFATKEPESDLVLGLRKKGGVIKWFSVNSSGLSIENNKEAVLLTFFDITNQKKSESYSKKLEEELFRVSLAAKQTTNPVILTDVSRKIIWINDAFSILTEYTEEEALGREAISLLVGTGAEQQADKMIRKKINEQQSISFRILNYTKSQKVIWTNMTIDPVYDDDQLHVGFIFVLHEITDKVEYEIALKEAKEKAEEMNRLKSYFLANMSHELRTPMVGILAYAAMLKDDLQDSSLKSYADTIYTSGNRLMQTLNSLLDLSKIEANKFEIIIKRVDLEYIAKEVVTLFKQEATKKELSLDLHIDENCKQVLLDERLMRTVLNNLISNAVKFTKSGGVQVVITSEESTQQYLVLKVIDTGIGIPDESLHLIFEGFRQISEGFNRNFEGVGLGLRITKKFIELLGGVIDVKSTREKGTVFTVKIPDALESNGTSERIEAISEHRPCVLSVEDDETSRNVLALCLRDTCTLDFAIDGFSALQKVNSKQYDAILMDINLGRAMNGVEVTQAIRKIPGYEHIPIVAITAYTMQGDKEEFLASGCSHYLAKPFEKQTIVNLMNSIFRESVNIRKIE